MSLKQALLLTKLSHKGSDNSSVRCQSCLFQKFCGSWDPVISNCWGLWLQPPAQSLQWAQFPSRHKIPFIHFLLFSPSLLQCSHTHELHQCLLENTIYFVYSWIMNLKWSSLGFFLLMQSFQMHGYHTLAFLKYVGQFLMQQCDFIITPQHKKL